MTELALLVLIICVCIIAIAFVAVIVTWAIKCILEWSNDIAYWCKEFKERYQNRKRHK